MSATVRPRTGAQTIVVGSALLLISVLLFSISAVAVDGHLALARHHERRHSRIIVLSNGILPPASLSTSYSTGLTVRGGAAPYQFALAGGTIAPGLSVNPSTGSVSGVPSAAGTFLFKVAIADQPRSETGEKWLKLVVGNGNPVPTNVIVTPPLATVGSGKSQQFAAHVINATNPAVTWKASVGSITSAGLFTAPQVTSNTTATITATSVANPQASGTANVAISAGSSPVTVVVSPNPANVSSGKTQQFTALVSNTSNTSVTWKASSGSISASGLFTAPTVSSATSATVTATSVVSSTASSSAMVTVSPSGPSVLAITTTAVPGGSTGSAYGFGLGASGGTTPYAWSLTSGSLPSGITLTANGMLSGTTSQTGQFSFVAQVMDASSPAQRATQSLMLNVSGAPLTTMDGPAQLPQVFMQTVLANTPANGQTWNVSSSSAFQQALNSAACGDTIALQAGAVFNGLFTFPQKPCDRQHWIVVRTSAPDTSLPPEGVRLTPCYAGVASMPGRPSFNCSGTQRVLPQISYSGRANGPIQFAAGANHYRLLGLEITRTVGTGPVGALISVPGGTGDSLIFDRLWVHGTALDETRRGVQLSATTNVAVVDSYLTDFHCIAVTGTCSDSQAVSGGTASSPTGPYKIVNNFLEAAGENVIFGGGGATMTPADIEIRRNHFFKPMIWMKGAPGYIGTAFVVKNHLELKNAQRVLVEANIFENSWGGFSQSGFSIVLTPKNQAIGTSNVCPICQVTDVTIRYNTISHVGGGFQIANAPSDLGGLPLDGQRYSIHDVVVDDINGAAYAGNGLFAQVSTLPNPILQNVTLNHITAFPQKTLLNIGGPMSPKMRNFLFTNSIVAAGIYPVWSTGGGTTNCAYYDVPVTTMAACFGPYAFASNAIIAPPTAFPVAKWPTGNAMPSTAASVQFVNFNNGNGGNYQLLPSSPYKNAASDGKDMGADINAINMATAGVL